ncbi:MAG TPA: type IV pilus secretin PilQ [Deltaproteobacteria bacterium]|nr:type IV pilus secretin PilQ [Deltaproteobacteria bacterium]HQB39835.1 type IV pilus secretin PilQ [Deltaproteobacteria bacterium]
MGRSFRKTVILSFVTLLSFGTVGGFTNLAESAQETAQPSKAKLASIESITTSGGGDAIDLIVKLTAPATYTSYKTVSPLRLVVDLSQVSPGAVSSAMVIDKANFKAATVNRYETDAGVLTRLEIELQQDLEAVLKTVPEKPGELHISFPGYTKAVVPNTGINVSNKVVASPPAVPAATGSDNKVEKATNNNAVTIPDTKKNGTESGSIGNQSVSLTSIVASEKSILLAISGVASDFKSFRLNRPERYVVDIQGAVSVLPARTVPINTKGVASARIGLYPDKVRVVFDAVSDSLPEVKAVKTADGILIEFLAGNTDNNKNNINSASPVKIATSPGQALNSTGSTAAVSSAPTGRKTLTPSVLKIEMIDFQVVNGISRVAVKTSGKAVIASPETTAGFVTLTLNNCQLPKQYQRSIETKGFISPVLRITPLQIKTRNGMNTKIRIAMRKAVPYEFKQESDMVFVDFKNPVESSSTVLQPPALKSKVAVATGNKASSLNELSGDPELKAGRVAKAGSGKLYRGRKVTLEFADAEVRKIFQLLSEVSNKNFVLGDDVTGAISIKLVNVPWDQALDIILETKGLDKREDGNIIVIKGKGKFKSQAEEDLEIKKQKYKSMELTSETFSVNYADLQGVVTQFNALKSERGVITPDTRTNKVIVKDIPLMIEEMRKVLVQLDIPEKQVMIEARIVEATSTFTQSLGVNWGVHYNSPASILYGINKIDSGMGGLTTAAPTSGVGTSPGINTDISFGTLGGNVKLDMRLSAAASAGLVKIVSSPKIATLNNKAAKITQGQSVPYTSSTSDKVETKFVEAALALEVTPHINPNGTISIKIDAKNDSVGSVPAGSTAPSINKKQATTEMLLKDGETTVIGGIYVDTDSSNDDGVPFLMDIPIFGNLFKTKSTTKVKTELLIFITPRIIVNGTIT